MNDLTKLGYYHGPAEVSTGARPRCSCALQNDHHLAITGTLTTQHYSRLESPAWPAEIWSRAFCASAIMKTQTCGPCSMPAACDRLIACASRPCNRTSQIYNRNQPARPDLGFVTIPRAWFLPLQPLVNGSEQNDTLDADNVNVASTGLSLSRLRKEFLLPPRGDRVCHPEVCLRRS